MSKRYLEQSWISPKLYTAPSSIQGTGVFTRQPIKVEEIVIVWGGQLFTQTDIDKGRVRQQTMVAIDEGLYLAEPYDADLFIDDYMNHSCDPNVFMKDEVTLIARRSIEAGEELTLDYATWLNDPSYVLNTECNCRTPNCRKIMTGNDWKRPDVQKAYRGHFSPFINHRIESLNKIG